jgi:hypothetical protein
MVALIRGVGRLIARIQYPGPPVGVSENSYGPNLDYSFRQGPTEECTPYVTDNQSNRRFLWLTRFGQK